ncbi:PP2C family protein-serine/threonine phosphatase [Yinghuangia aomiensis]
MPAAEGAQVGGDWYDAATLPDGRTLVAIGDVSGHGLPAAAAMTQLRHALRGMAYTGAEPATILRRLNEMVCSQRSDYIATAICAHVDPKTTELTWAQAGHPPPVHMRAGVPRVLEPPHGMVLGATPDAQYATGSVALAPGDMLLMYTDGLVARCGDDSGRGLSRLVRSLRGECLGRPPGVHHAHHARSGRAESAGRHLPDRDPGAGSRTVGRLSPVTGAAAENPAAPGRC